MSYNPTNWQNLPSATTPVIAEKLNNMEAGIVEIDERGNYSTTEKVIGTWIDGKPLYAKTYNTYTTSESGSNVTYFLEENTNFAKGIDVKKYDYSVKIEYQSSGNFLKAYNGSNGALGTFYFGHNITGGNIYIDRSSFTATYYVRAIEATIYYTKSSD